MAQHQAPCGGCCRGRRRRTHWYDLAITAWVNTSSMLQYPSVSISIHQCSIYQCSICYNSPSLATRPQRCCSPPQPPSAHMMWLPTATHAWMSTTGSETMHAKTLMCWHTSHRRWGVGGQSASISDETPISFFCLKVLIAVSISNALCSWNGRPVCLPTYLHYRSCFSQPCASPLCMNAPHTAVHRMPTPRPSWLTQKACRTGCLRR